MVLPGRDRQVALKLDSMARCREISHLLGRARLAMTELENEGLAGCSFAVKTVPLKSANGLFLDIEAPGAFQPAFI